jgi:hypothetical protein
MSEKRDARLGLNGCITRLAWTGAAAEAVLKSP